jgi:hypothetical protein
MMAEPQAKTADEQPQQPAMPTGDQKVPDAVAAQEAAPVSEEATEATTSELPADAKQRTKEQFDKLNREKDALRQERDQYKQMLNQPQKPKGESKPIYDPKTGLVDVEGLNQLGREVETLKQENQQLRQQTRDNQTTELVSAYPELDPSNKDKFNQEFFDEADRLYLHSLAYPERYGGRALTQRQAADRAKKRFAKKESPEEQKQRESVKEQASLETSGRPGQGVKDLGSDEERQRLVMGTRLGDKQSMIERMRAIREAKEKKGGE